MMTELRCPCIDRMSVTFFCLETKRCLKLISLELKSTIPTRCILLSSHSVALLLEGNLVMDYDDDDYLIGKTNCFCVGNVARMAGIGEGTGPLSVEVPVERVRQFVYQVGVV